MKHKNRSIALLLIVLLLCAFPMTVHAREVPDESKTGTITVEMYYADKPVTGGILSAYYVGDVQEKDGSCCFVKTPELEAFSGEYTHIESPELAEELAAFIREHSVSAYAAVKNKAGTATFSKLKLGLYLIIQTEASDGYEPLKPFLVSVPMNEDGHYIYQVNAEGKFQLHQEQKHTTLPKPSAGVLPQTGQLNWPIPILAVMGLSLFSIGWIRRAYDINE